MGNFQKQRISSGPWFEKEMHKEGLQRNPWSMLARSCFPWTDDSTQFVVHGTFLQEQDHTYRMSEAEYFHYTQNCWISLNKSGNNTNQWENFLTSTKRFLHLKRLHREAGGQQLGPIPYWKYKDGDRHRVLPPPGGNGANPGGLPKNSKKVNKEAKQRLSIELGNPCCRTLAKTSDEWLSRVHVFFTARSFTADGGLL